MNDNSRQSDDISPFPHKKYAENFLARDYNSLDNTDVNKSTNFHFAKKLYGLRRKRDTLFSDGLFSEPAWDILLDLYISQQTGKEICITSACIAAGVPLSTGLRWLAILVQNGYVERREDSVDTRRSLVNLTPKACEALETLFGQPD